MPRKDMLPILVDSWYTRAHITKDDTSIIYSNINLTMIRKKMNKKTFWQPPATGKIKIDRKWISSRYVIQTFC